MLKCDRAHSSCSDHVADKKCTFVGFSSVEQFSRNGSSRHVQVLSCRISPDLCFCPICQEYLATGSVVSIFLKDYDIQC
jgi:hypothetical protein